MIRDERYDRKAEMLADDIKFELEKITSEAFFESGNDYVMDAVCDNSVEIGQLMVFAEVPSFESATMTEVRAVYETARALIRNLDRSVSDALRITARDNVMERES